MRFRPIDRRLLTHTVYWSQKKLSSTSDAVKIEKVFIPPTPVWFATAPQQTSQGNRILYYDCRFSSKIKDSDGKAQIPAFAVGDTIRIERGPINNFPYIFTIRLVRPYPDVDNKTLHHIELELG